MNQRYFLGFSKDVQLLVMKLKQIKDTQFDLKVTKFTPKLQLLKKELPSFFQHLKLRLR